MQELKTAEISHGHTPVKCITCMNNLFLLSFIRLVFIPTNKNYYHVFKITDRRIFVNLTITKMYVKCTTTDTCQRYFTYKTYYLMEQSESRERCKQEEIRPVDGMKTLVQSTPSCCCLFQTDMGTV